VPELRHQRGRLDAVAGHVAQHQADAAVVEAEDVVPVAADLGSLGGRHVAHRGAHALELGQLGGEEGALERLGDAALVLEDARVVDGHRGALGCQLQQGDVVAGERARLERADVQDAEDLVADDQRDADHRLEARLAQSGAENRLVRMLVDDQCLALGRHPAGEAAADSDAEAELRGAEAARGAELERLAVIVHEHDGAVLDVERVADSREQFGEQVLEAEVGERGFGDALKVLQALGELDRDRGGRRLLLRLALAGYVAARADHADDVALGVRDRAAMRFDQAHVAVGSDHAVLEAEVAGVGEGEAHRGVDALAIVGVNALEVAVVAGVEVLGLDAVDPVELLRPGDDVVRDVPGPAPHLGDRLGFREAGGGLAHLRVRGVHLGHVLADADHPHGVVVRVDDDPAAAVEHADGAVGADDALVELERLVVRVSALDGCGYPFAVVGMDALEVGLVARLVGLGRGAVDRVQLVRPLDRASLDVPLPDAELGHLLGGAQLLLAIEKTLAEHGRRIVGRLRNARSAALAGLRRHGPRVLPFHPIRMRTSVRDTPGLHPRKSPPAAGGKKPVNRRDSGAPGAAADHDLRLGARAAAEPAPPREPASRERRDAGEIPRIEGGRLRRRAA
jgi:hypothetical protein